MLAGVEWYECRRVCSDQSTQACALPGICHIPDSHGIRAEQFYCASGKLGSEDHSDGVSSMAPEEMWLVPHRLRRALSGWVSRSDCALLRSTAVGVRKRSVPVVVVMAVSEVWSVARFFYGGMYWGSGFLHLVCA